MAILKFNENSNTKVKLEYATGKEVESKFKDKNGNPQKQYLWSCNGGDDLIYASPSLNAMFMSETKGMVAGTEVEVKKVDSGNTDPKGDNIFVFAVNNQTIAMRNKGVKPEEVEKQETDDEPIPF